MLRNRNQTTFLATPRTWHAASARGRTRRYRPRVDRLEDRVALSTANEVWYPSSSPGQSFPYGAADWVPVNIGGGNIAVVDTSGNNPVDYGADVWYPSNNQTHPFAYGAAGWVPVAFANGSIGVVDTSGDNKAYPGSDVWYLTEDQNQPFPYGNASWVPLTIGNNPAVVDTSGSNPTYPHTDVWYTTLTQNQPFSYGKAGWAPVGFNNNTIAAVDTSGNNPVDYGADVWYSNGPSGTFAYGAAGWVPLSFGVGGGYAVVNTSGGIGATPSNYYSTNWSGYAVTAVTDGVTNVRGSWYVPSVSGGTNASSSTWVGIDGFNGDSTLEQTGTSENIVNGAPQYYAWYEMVPSQPNVEVELNPAYYPVAAGDLIAANVTYVGNGQFTLALTDATAYGGSGWNFITTQAFPAGITATRSTAEWIQEAPTFNGTEASLANFGTVTFSNMLATISGATLPINGGNIDDAANTNFFAVTMNSPSGNHATPSLLNPAGNSFNVAFGGSAPAAPSTGPDIAYYGPMLPSSTNSGTAGAASVSVSASSIAPVGPFFGIAGSTSASKVADPPTQALQPGTGLPAFVAGRKLPNQGSARSSFSNLLSSADES